jgi:hypothetical protein
VGAGSSDTGPGSKRAAFSERVERDVRFGRLRVEVNTANDA